MAAQSSPINVTGTGVVNAGTCTLRGYSIASTAGATVVIYDNASAASGTVLGQFILAAGADRQLDISDGVRCANGIYLAVTAGGPLQGHIRIG